MTIVRCIFVVASLVCLFASARAQSLTLSSDRIICGNANLSYVAKTANVKDNELLKVLRNSKVNVIIIQRLSETDNALDAEQRVLYVLGRETRYRDLKISKLDYDWLIKVANELHQE